ncbi:MAG: hypothetical protein HY319_06485 [Armatimonadetes bacterium]|nr:hypothetical protein [Armatimonadota bacterium]
MAISILIALSASWLGWMMSRRLLAERDVLLCGALSPLLGASATILAANWIPHARRELLIGIFLGLGALLLLKKGMALEIPRLSRGLAVSLAVSSVCVLFYTAYAQMRFLDTDNWIHEPLIASYIKGVFPPVNPYVPESPLTGHYGRDLLMATLSPAGADPLGTVWSVNLVLQLAGFLALFSSVRVLTGAPGDTGSGLRGILAALMGYYGVCVGIRVGLADSFDGNNGVVYSLLILLFHLMLRVVRGEGGAGLWVLAGVVLGGYQIVYETHFGLLMLTGLIMAAWHLRIARAWAGVLVVAALALLLAFTEGGPLTQMLHPKPADADQNVTQYVTMKFPKEHLFQVLVTTADYQRLSAAYRTSLFEGLKPVIQGEGYMHIFDPRFLCAHWMPLLLCPLSLFTLVRRGDGVGQAYWVFGALAYLVPALVDFGMYENEYFRWEFAAGFGFAVALGIALGHWLSAGTGSAPVRLQGLEDGWGIHIARRGPLWLGAILVLIASLAAGENIVNDAIIDVQKGRVNWSADPGAWRVAQPELGIAPADIEAMDWLAPRVAPRDRVLSNLGSETPAGIWPDSVLAARTGAFPAGRSQPPRGTLLHAHPFYHRAPVARAFYATGRPELVSQAGVQWLFLDIDRLAGRAWLELESRKLESSPVFQDKENNRRQVFRLPPPEEVLSPPGLKAQVALPGNTRELRAATRYPVRLHLENPGDRPLAIGWLETRVVGPDGGDLGQPPLRILEGELAPGASAVIEHSLVTPLEEGRYLLEVSRSQGGEVLARLPFEVDFRERLGAIQARLDLPDSFVTRRFYKLRMGLTPQRALRAEEDELEFYYRLRRGGGGEYVWELDSIPQPIELELEPGVEREYFVDMLTPWEPGSYEPELYLREKSSGQSIRLQGQIPPIHVRPEE